MLLSFSILFHPSSFCFEKSVFSGNNKGIKLFSANFAVLAIFDSLKHLYRSGCISIFQLHIKVLSSSNTCKGHNAVYHCAKSSPSASYLTYTPLTLRRGARSPSTVTGVYKTEEKKLPTIWK